MFQVDVDLKAAIFASFTLLLLYLGYVFILLPNYVPAISNVPGPPPASLIAGSLPTIYKAEPGSAQDAWIEQYGSVIQYRGFLGESTLYIADPKALNHILMTNCYDYPKPQQFRGQLAKFLGKGILFAEGDDHKRQRRILNQPFTQSMVNSYQLIFQEQSNRMRDRMIEELETATGPETENTVRDDWRIVEVSRWLSRCTLDIIGFAGFDYDFGALDNADNKLAKVYQAMLRPREMKVWMLVVGTLIYYLPFLQKIPTKAGKAMKHALQTIEAEARKMLARRKEWAENGELDDKKDLMSLMYKANLQAASKKDRMMDEELMGQITTFILAGHETSATALTWILYHLSRDRDMQQRLRDEIHEARSKATAEGRSAISAEELTALPFMDALIRETLRIEPPATLTVRAAGRDDMIPLHKPIVGRDGQIMTWIPVKKGQDVLIGIGSLHKNTDIYGADAKLFNPDRWLKQEGVGDLQLAKGFTVWSQILTFLGGPRGCIGYRFALLEIKTILATLIEAFEFLERDEAGTRIVRRANMVTRPVVVGEEELGARLPLRIRRVNKE